MLSLLKARNFDFDDVSELVIPLQLMSAVLVFNDPGHCAAQIQATENQIFPVVLHECLQLLALVKLGVYA